MCGQDSVSSLAHAFVVRGYWEIVNKKDTDAFSVSVGFNWGWMGGYGGWMVSCGIRRIRPLLHWFAS